MKTQSIFSDLEKNRLDIYQMNIVRGGNKGGSGDMDEDILIPDPVDGDDDTTT